MSPLSIKSSHNSEESISTEGSTPFASAVFNSSIPFSYPWSPSDRVLWSSSQAWLGILPLLRTLSTYCRSYQRSLTPNQAEDIALAFVVQQAYRWSNPATACEGTCPRCFHHERRKLLIIPCPDQRQNLVDLEIDQIEGLSIVRVFASSEGTGEIRILLFLNLGQEEPFAYKPVSYTHLTLPTN